MKKYFTTSILIAQSFFLIAFLGGCSKNGILPGSPTPPATEYYFRCKIDGVLKNFAIPDSAYLPVSPSNGVYSFGCGAIDNLTDFNTMSVNINDYTSTPITAGKKYNPVFESNGTITVQPWIYYANLAGDGYFSNMAFKNSLELTEVVLTEITDKYVKGTFKGKLLVDETATPVVVKYSVTEGEFYLPRSKKLISSITPSGDGFIEGEINGKKFSVKEADDGLNRVWAEITSSTSSSSGTDNLYKISINGNSNVLLPTFNSLSLDFFSLSPFSTGTFEITPVLTNTSYVPFLCSAQYKENNNLITYVATTSTINSNQAATIKFTKYSEKKGDYIEGTYTVSNAFYKGGITGPYSLTNGKFRAKLD